MGFILFMVFYVVPAFLVLAGARPLIAQDRNFKSVAVIMAFIPIFNILFAGFAIIVLAAFMKTRK